MRGVFVVPVRPVHIQPRRVGDVARLSDDAVTRRSGSNEIPADVASIHSPQRGIRVPHLLKARAVLCCFGVSVVQEVVVRAPFTPANCSRGAGPQMEWNDIIAEKRNTEVASVCGVRVG